MSTIPILHRNPEQIGLPELLAYVDQVAPTRIAADSLALALHRERMCVAGAYAHEYLDRCGRHPSLLEFASLDGDRVAAVIAPDLDRKGQTGIANAVAALVEHARELLDVTVVTAEEILSGTPTGWSVSTRCDQAELDPGSNRDSSHPRRVRITIDLDLGSGPDDGPSGGDPTVTPR